MILLSTDSLESEIFEASFAPTAANLIKVVAGKVREAAYGEI